MNLNPRMQNVMVTAIVIILIITVVEKDNKYNLASILTIGFTLVILSIVEATTLNMLV